ncbi:MAG: ferredoxin family protein [Deltaproteobacteria bacterium]|nr:ferredoxin family protein [Deltaproteobacteria bacterium]
MLTEKEELWKGIPRKQIEWHPFIDTNKCTGCGMCVTSCRRGVFDYDIAKEKAVVVNPLNCMVGCTSCKTWCYFDAINFPDTKYIKNLIKEMNVLAFVKNELQHFLKEKEQRKNTQP